MAMALHIIHIYKLQNVPSAGRLLKHAAGQTVLPECHDTVCYTGQINTRCTVILLHNISWCWGCIGGLQGQFECACIQTYWSNHLLQWWLQHQQ